MEAITKHDWLYENPGLTHWSDLQAADKDNLLLKLCQREGLVNQAGYIVEA